MVLNNISKLRQFFLYSENVWQLTLKQRTENDATGNSLQYLECDNRVSFPDMRKLCASDANTKFTNIYDFAAVVVVAYMHVIKMYVIWSNIIVTCIDVRYKYLRIYDTDFSN